MRLSCGRRAGDLELALSKGRGYEACLKVSGGFRNLILKTSCGFCTQVPKWLRFKRECGSDLVNDELRILSMQPSAHGDDELLV